MLSGLVYSADKYVLDTIQNLLLDLSIRHNLDIYDRKRFEFFFQYSISTFLPISIEVGFFLFTDLVI